MAKKTKKKKYTPRPVYIPQMVVGITVFDPLFKALDAIVNTGEVETDELGVYAYTNSKGEQKSIESSLLLYMRYADIYAIRNNTSFDARPLERLRRAIQGQSDEFTEKEILDARACLEKARRLLSCIPPAEHRAIIKTIYTEYELKNGNVLPQTAALMEEIA